MSKYIKREEYIAFARLVATMVTKADFEEDAGTFSEIACRWLRYFGIVTSDDEFWNFTPTHADEIRAMSDEELAKKLASFRCPHKICFPEGGENCKSCWLDWLKEAEE